MGIKISVCFLKFSFTESLIEQRLKVHIETQNITPLSRWLLTVIESDLFVF
jgi:hypothetical protein